MTTTGTDVITFDNVCKRFVLNRERARSFQDLLVNLGRRGRGRRQTFWALDGVSFSVPRGQMLGLIGPNGAGKSTSLKLITRILQPTSGRVAVHGRVAALLELGTGFHPDLTGRENIFLNGSLLGFSRKQMRQRMDSIIDFAGIEPFIDMPVRHYSSGMFMRLGFSIAVHAEPDILITDEVLAVGDEAFQNKCLERMRQFREQGVTIILVSHALPTVRRLCDRVIWLEHGGLVMDGAPGDIIDAYAKSAGSLPRSVRDELHDEVIVTIPGPPPPAVEVARLGDAHIVGVELLAPDGTPRWDMQAGEKMALRVYYEALADLPDAVITMQIHDAADEALISGLNTFDEGVPVDLVAGEGSIDLLDLPLPLRHGEYLLSVAIFARANPPLWGNPDDIQRFAYSLTVHSSIHSPQRRWGSGECLIDDVHICGDDGQDKSDFQTGETLRLSLRCIRGTARVENPLLRVHVIDSNGVICHATNSERASLKLGRLDQPLQVTLQFDELRLLQGDYTVSAGLWPNETARLAYDWHDSAYAFHVHSTYRDGGGVVALPHRWIINN